MAIRFDQLPKRDEFFGWTDQRTGEVYFFAVTRLNTYLKGTAFPVTDVALTRDLLLSIATQNGVEPDHLERISPERLEEPALMIDMGDGTHIVADGSHRIIKRGLMGMIYAPAWLTPERLWRRFLIEGMPGGAEAWKEHWRSWNP